jgi:hypothetical protein
MTYLEFKSRIQGHLENHPDGATWRELRDALELPYERPCPEWTRRLENEIGLVRRKGEGRGFNWSLERGPGARF